MTIEQIFNDRKVFKDTLIAGVQEELDQFGLKIYNANIKELQDYKGSEYFSFLRQKRRSEAENNAKIDVAEANKKGDIGKKEREAATRQEVAQFEANAVLKENERNQEIAKSMAELDVVKEVARQKTETARIEADNNIKIREAEMQKEVEFKRIAMETEKMRASDLSKTQVEAEKVTKEAEGNANAIKIKADADFYANQKAADARLYSKQKEADGIAAIYNAQSKGVMDLISSFKEDSAALMQYMMLDRGTFEALAKTNATAIQNLKPSINIWQTTSDPNTESYTKPIADIMKMIPPLVTTINDQTGIKFAEGLVKLPPSSKNMT